MLRRILFLLLCLLAAGQVYAQDGRLTSGQHDLSLSYQNMTRTFRVYVPENLPTEPVPLVIVMHGASGNGEWMERFTQFDDLADANDFVVVYPDGVNGIWNDGRAGDSRVPSSLDDVGFISALIDDLSEQLNIDATRVYAAGHSMGGMMAFRLACELQDKIAAIASVSSTFPGYLYTNCEKVQPIPVMIIQGTADTVIPWQGIKQGEIPIYFSAAESAVYWAITNGCEQDPQMIEGLDLAPDDGTVIRQIEYKTCTNDANVAVYAVIGGGHTWPGTQLNINMGAVSRDLYASPTIWKFFEAHHLKQ